MEGVTVLNLGCGRAKALPPWAAELEFDDGAGGIVKPDAVRIVHVDELTSVAPDVVCRLGAEPLAVADESVDVAFAMHVLEHVGEPGKLAGWFSFWEDLYRVMKPGARLYFECPYYTSVWAWADPTHVRAISEWTFLYLGQQNYAVGGAIPDYRPEFDFRLEDWTLIKDGTNPSIQAREPDGSMIRGVLRAHKPLERYWSS